MADLSVVIPVWAFDDRMHKVAEASLRSFRKNTPGAEFMVVDNGSEPPLRQSDMRFDENVGYIAAVNAGLEQTSRQWIAVGSCDVIVPSGWWKPLLREGIASPVETPAATRKQLAYRGSFFGPLFVMHRNVYDTIGGIDPQWLNMGDRDYAIRAAIAGFPVESVPEVKVEHRDKSRGTGSEPDDARQTERDKFRRVWGAGGFGQWERRR